MGSTFRGQLSIPFQNQIRISIFKPEIYGMFVLMTSSISSWLALATASLKQRPSDNIIILS